MKQILFAAGLSLLTGMAVAQNSWTVTSPDKQLVVTINNIGQELSYDVALKGKTILNSSPLGITTSRAAFTKGLTVASCSEIEKETASYTLSMGKTSSVFTPLRNRTLTVKNAQGQTVDLLFKVSNNGFAYAYRFATPQTITGENSGFAIPANSKSFLTPLSKAKSGWCETNPSYEDHYQIGVSTDNPSDYGQGWIYPALFETPDHNWILLSETGNDRNYVATHLSDAKNGVFSVSFPYPDHNLADEPTSARQETATTTPWRIGIVGSSLQDIVRSTFSADIVKPIFQPSETYKPGMASWSWLVYDDSYTTYEGTKAFIDLAAHLKLPYCLIDALWDIQIGRDKMKELASYARSKGVALSLWYNSNGKWNTAPQTPKDKMIDPKIRRSEMKWLKELGIKCIKVDFFGGDKQSSMRLYEDILRDANDYGIGVVFHGCTLPRGWDRMYPNFISAEAVMGQEFCKYDQRNEDLRAQHCTVLPFTRNVVAPMDFTPTVLNARLGKKPTEGSVRQTTAAFELALPVIFYSPVTHLGIVPKNLMEFPSFVWEYISKLPTVWDSTMLLSGYPGKDVIISRTAKGGATYIAGINGEDKTKTIRINLPVLSGTTSVQVIRTPKTDRNQVQLETVALQDGQISIELQPKDGFIVLPTFGNSKK